MTNTHPNIIPKPTAHNFRDLEGRQFGNLTILGYVGKTKHGNAQWLAKCECGKQITASSGHLLKSHTKSCGCLRIGPQIIHGESQGGKHSREYRAYRGAKRRCNNPNSKDFTNYGGRGIQFRFTSFEQFLAEIGRRPRKSYSLDRIDNNGHYEPGNVRWAAPKTQGRNQRTNRMITFQGQTRCLSEWSEMLGIHQSTMFKRLYYSCWSVEKALTHPVRKW